MLDPVLQASDAHGLAPAVGAALSIGLSKERGIGTTVLMPYCDRLGYFGFWYRQLWAESLGKGGNGTTPVRAMGTVDQHSQLQLYLGGPADKMFTVVILDTAGQGKPIPPAADLVQPMPYCALQSLVDAGNPFGRRQYWRSDNLSALDDDTIDTLVACANRTTSPFSTIILQPGGHARDPAKRGRHHRGPCPGPA